MHVEVSVALNFVISYLYNKLPRRRVDMFGEELERGLKKKFEGHWYVEKPFKGSAFRCIRVSGEKIDPVIEHSAFTSGLNIDEVKEFLPKDLTVWIDPNEVSYRIGEKGTVKLLYSERVREEELPDNVDREVQNANKGFNPEAQSFKPIDSLSSSMGNLSLSPSPNGWGHGASTSPTHGPQAPTTNSTSPVTSFINRNNNLTTFTAASFAATKFGSTKLKTHAKRPTRLSPTEFGAYLKQRSTVQLQQSPVAHPGPMAALMWNSPGAISPVHTQAAATQAANRLLALSPADPRQDFFEHQHLLLLQHQHQQQQHQQQQQQQSPQRQLLQQQQQQQNQFLSANPLSPHGGSLNELYSTLHSPKMSPASTPIRPGLHGGINCDLLLTPPGKAPSMPSLQTSPSPTDASKTFIDGINWNTLPQQYANLQHLLVAN